jgi:rSAM/selenodomain-associated transferase 1
MKKIKIIVMAKAPIPGFAKTRLIPALGAEGAAKLAQQLLLHTLANVRAADVGETELCVTPGLDQPEWNSLRSIADVHWTLQCEGDLGQRLAYTCQRAIAQGNSVLVIGTDCPALSANIIQRAAQALQDCNAVIIPATDGGYTLLGTNEFHATLFENIHWSTDTVLTETLERIQKLQWRVEVLAPLHDIDEPEDLRWLPEPWKEDLYLTSIIALN